MNVSINIHKLVGTMVQVEIVCFCGRRWWSSQRQDGQMPSGNLMLASGIMLSGSSAAKVIHLFQCLKMPVFTSQTYCNLHSCYFVPSIHDIWPKYQDILLEHLAGKAVVVGGDARCHSPSYSAKYGSYTLIDLDPSYSAKYGSYTLIDLDPKLILDIQLVQSNEVKSSCNMELAGLKRAISLLEGQGCHIAELVTDCHVQVAKGSRAYKAVKEVVESKYLLCAIPKLSPLYQTYSLEVFHNVVNHFAPKSHHFFYPAMKARMYIAAFHYNENSQITQAVTKAGEPRWTISYPKAKKGTSSVAKPVNKGPTHEYVEFLLNAIEERRNKFPSYKIAEVTMKD